MKQSLLSLLVLLLAGTLYAQPSDAFLNQALTAGRMPGGSFTVVKDGQWVYHRSLGKASIAENKNVTPQTVFMMASVSKTMIATAAMQLWERGRLNLDVDINRYLSFPVRNPAHPADSISTRMLLTHTSSIEDDVNTLSSLYVYGDSPIPLDSFLKNYLVPGGLYFNATNNFSTALPGGAHSYSNVASTLAAYVVEAITGDAFHHYCDTAIFQKLCMSPASFTLSGIADTALIARPYYWDNGTYVDAGLYGYPDYPDGQLRTDAPGLSRFMTALLNHGVLNGARILDSATVAYMLQSQTSVSPYMQGIIFYAAPSSSGDLLWGHNGGDAGVNTAMYFNPQKKLGVIVLTNGDGTNSMSADALADTLYSYGLSVVPQATDSFPACRATSVGQVSMDNVTLKVYPNPAGSQLTIETGSLPGVFRVCDLTGREVLHVMVGRLPETTISVAELPRGLYLYDWRDATGGHAGGKLVVE